MNQQKFLTLRLRKFVGFVDRYIPMKLLSQKNISRNFDSHWYKLTQGNSKLTHSNGSTLGDNVCLMIEHSEANQRTVQTYRVDCLRCFQGRDRVSAHLGCNKTQLKLFAPLCSLKGCSTGSATHLKVKAAKVCDPATQRLLHLTSVIAPKNECQITVEPFIVA